MTAARVVAKGFEFPEGPAFTLDGDLFLVNVEGGYLSRVPDGGMPEIYHHTSGKPNGLAIAQDGTLYVADAGLAAIVRVDPDRRTQEVVVDAYHGERLRGPNDLCFDRAGALYFTDPLESSLERPIGRVFRLAPGGELTVVVERMAFPNGLCLSADERVLYLAETMRHTIHACLLDAHGEVVEMHAYAEVEGGPDGMALDVEGNLYVALYGRGAVGVIPSGGGAVRYLVVEGSNPTNLAFRGTKIFITEASQGSLQVMDVGVEGLALVSHG